MSQFVLSAKEVSDKVNLPIQKIYILRDCSTKAQNPRRPVLQRNIHWKFEEGRVIFTKEAVSLIQEWKEKLNNIKKSEHPMESRNHTNGAKSEKPNE